ncbi:hypothetical protein EAE96_002922 [Botrytis aclada]|nr:hypothetical protein EAE96_002922 [Botrytis aclada]
MAMQAMKERKDDSSENDQLVTDCIEKLEVLVSDYERLGEAAVEKSAENRASANRRSIEFIRNVLMVSINYPDH